MSVFTHVIFHRFYRFDTIFQVSKYDVGRVMYRAFRTHLYHSSHTDGNYCTSPYRGLKRFCVNDYSVTIDKQHQNILPFILQCDFCYFHYIVF